MIFIIDNNRFYRLVVAALEQRFTNWTVPESTTQQTQNVFTLYLGCSKEIFQYSVLKAFRPHLTFKM